MDHVVRMAFRATMAETKNDTEFWRANVKNIDHLEHARDSKNVNIKRSGGMDSSDLRWGPFVGWCDNSSEP